MKDNTIMNLIWLATVVFAFVCGIIVGNKDERNLKRELVTKGVAEYNNTNGVWQLKEIWK